nr:MAG TPA: peptidase [Caudoviricetes sp.]
MRIPYHFLSRLWLIGFIIDKIHCVSRLTSIRGNVKP